MVRPAEVRISGPREQVEQVSQVVGRLFLQEAKTDVERQVSLLVRDNQNRPVDKVDIAPATADVRVPGVERQGFKEMSVKVITEGDPAPGLLPE